MSSAHASMRFFGVGSGYRELDQALVDALEGDPVDWAGAATKYAEALVPVCALEVSSRPLLPARVERLGPLALIRPGTGALHLPPGVRGVLVDLRGLPEDPALAQGLEKVIAVSSATPVPRVSRRVRTHKGMVDEYTPYNYFENRTEQLSVPSYPAEGPRDLPMLLLTGPRMAPTAARFALDLRMARRAWLVGEAVHVSVAESRWMPVGTRGLVFRTEQLEDSEGVLPDVIPADLELGLSLRPAESQRLTQLGVPPPVARTLAVTRPAMLPRTPHSEPLPPVGASPGIARANLLIVHGALKRFFPYLHIVGDVLDERLLALLAAVDEAPVDRARVGLLLRYLGVAIQDGHVRVSILGGTAGPGVFPVVIAEVAGEPVVRRSLTPGVEPGDTLVSIDGRPATEWMAEEMAQFSAATPGYRFIRGVERLRAMRGPMSLGLRAADGTTRTVQVLPQPPQRMDELGTPPSMRRAGWLADLGAPALYYINLTYQVLPTLEDFRSALTEAEEASGLVLDMRGYPGNFDATEIIQRLNPATTWSPIFRTSVSRGLEARDVDELQFVSPPLSAPSFHGPIVLLVGPATLSSAENLSMYLVGADRVTVLGRQSAGTNGNITRLYLPGYFLFSFTGMEVLYPDRSAFHGVGIVPDIEVIPTAAELAAGKDPELLRAIQHLLLSP
ncbi:S41 family peptidase [Myxococcus stipitatus]|uniref:S41 family peptidase n=1 Tax=Myxococcus stipitatus TaxID=83455 RepID=UPI001F20B70C|nr:S41 family peptidase [Myxococcus stipitatus]MCE9666684.1 S41 family peptidase [Myxococcus stipitatus]